MDGGIEYIVRNRGDGVGGSRKVESRFGVLAGRTVSWKYSGKFAVSQKHTNSSCSSEFECEQIPVRYIQICSTLSVQFHLRTQ